MIVIHNLNRDNDSQWKYRMDKINTVKPSFDKKIRTDEERALAVEHLSKIKRMIEELKK